MRKHSLVVLVSFAAAVVAGPAAAQSAGAVTTYHYDRQRTGWNSHETTLTPTNVTPSTFGILATVPLDDQVDAQPLFVPNQKITISGVTSKHDVVYVATDSNTIYVIDTSSYKILLKRNLGTPVNVQANAGCGAPTQGIMGTPVIDLNSSTLFVIAYPVSSPQIFQIHALKLSDLTDKAGSPQTVNASHTLMDPGSTTPTNITFDATWLRQRPALLHLNNNIYAGFGSLCDSNNNVSESRGWLLGWNLGLVPLRGNELTNTRQTDPLPLLTPPTNPVFLSSIWMSGYGIAGLGNDVYFATGNSDCNFLVSPEQCPSQTTYDGKTNVQESVVRLRGDLTTMDGIFTPGIVTPAPPNPPNPSVLTMDRDDADLGSGGVLLFPTKNGNYPFLAVAGGKVGTLFLLDPRHLSVPLDTHNDFEFFGTWSGPSFFRGADGINRIVTSHGFANPDSSFNPTTASLETWQVQFSPGPHLVHEATATIGSGQDPGFFTSVSSKGTEAGTAIIWAVGRPFDTSTTFVNLYAFNAAASGGTLTQLFTSPAGCWPNTGANANIVPVVAKGKVYVASFQSLVIFGSTGTPITLPAGCPVAPLASPHEISGTILTVSGSTLTLKKRTGESATIDASHAKIGAHLKKASPVTALGSSFSGSGALQATVIVRAKGSSGDLWPPDD